MQSRGANTTEREPLLQAADILRGAYSDRKFADFTLRFQDEEYKIHKVIVYGQSSLLDSYCLDSKIEITDDIDAQQLKCLVYYLYNFEYCRYVTPEQKSQMFPSDPRTESPASASTGQTAFKYTGGKRVRVSTEAIESVHLTGVFPRRYQEMQPAGPRGADAPKFGTTCVDVSGNELLPMFHAGMYALALRWKFPALSAYASRMYEDSLSIYGLFSEKEGFRNSIAAVYGGTAKGDKLRAFVVRYAAKYTLNAKELEAGAKWRSVVADVPEFKEDLAMFFTKPETEEAESTEQVDEDAPGE